jgi:hypothetical protein
MGTLMEVFGSDYDANMDLSGVFSAHGTAEDSDELYDTE